MLDMGAGENQPSYGVADQATLKSGVEGDAERRTPTEIYFENTFHQPKKRSIFMQNLWTKQHSTQGRGGVEQRAPTEIYFEVNS